MVTKKPITKYGMVGIFALVAILATSTVVLALSQSAIAAPANKSAFGGSDVVVVPGIQSVESNPNYDGFQTIVQGTIKTSAPSDLLVRHDQECAIHTGLNLDTTNDDATSAVREEVRLKVTDEDKNVRYISPMPLGTEGQVTGEGAFEKADDADSSNVAVTMCGRAYHIDTNVLDKILELCNVVEGITEEDITCDDTEPVFNSFIASKAAHGWSWVVPNMGSGTHTIEVQAKLVDNLADISKKGKDTTNRGNDLCLTTDGTNVDCVDTVLEVGKRSLIITEQKFSSDI